MKLFFFTLLCCVMAYGTNMAQKNYAIKGVVADTADNNKLSQATISVLNAKDSTLYKFTRADANGKFSISPMRKGNFILLLTYPAYADYVSTFILDSVKSEIDFGQINMKTKARLLNEVLIKGQAAAIKIKGDTTEFNAASYTIQPNDKVEDLLKKLPGIQVDKDGKITAQGKTVPKVLVDGEEFFGDDPTLVTKNLRADMVDKVQFYEKTSDQAAFTGVDDGEKTPTINIKLKEDKKNGYFGKVDVGAGTDDFYQGQVMFNRFKAKQKFSLYGTLGNNGKTGLSWEDGSKYGGTGGNMEVSGDMIFFTGGGDDIDGWEGQYYGEGLPVARNGGAHYDSKWNNDKETINTNYKIGSLGVKSFKNTLENNLTEGIIFTNSDEVADKYIFRQKLDATYTLKIDTMSNLKVSVDGTLKNSDNLTNYKSIAVRGDETRLNDSERSVNNHGKEDLFNISAFYNRKLKKKGRNFSINISQRINNKDSKGFLYSKNNFYEEDGSFKESTIVDQYKNNIIKTNTLNSNFTFNEPLSKSLTLVLNYGFTYTVNDADKKSFNAAANGEYTVLDEEFSNDFRAKLYTNQGGVMFNYKKLKTVLNFGTRINAIRFDQYEALSKQSYNRSFINWIPQLTYQYKFSAQRSIRLNYYGNTSQPSVEQLQPVKVNTDPLNIPLGNPNLKPSYNSNISLGYNTYKMLSNQSFYINGNFGFTNNQIVNSAVTDTAGVTVRQSVNLDDEIPFNYNVYSGFSRKIKALGSLEFGVSLSASGSRSYNYANSLLNKTTSSRFGPRLNVNRYAEKFEVSLSFGPSYNAQEASVQKSVNNKGWGSTGYGSFKVNLPKKITIQSDADYTYTPKSTFSPSFEQTIINGSISKAFFKGETLKAMVKVNDLLNQNSGFSRSAYGNLITQTTFNNINRYYMFSLIWDFNKMGGVSAKK